MHRNLMTTERSSQRWRTIPSRVSMILVPLTTMASLILLTGCPGDDQVDPEDMTTPDASMADMAGDLAGDMDRDQPDAMPPQGACDVTVQVSGEFALTYSDSVSVEYEASIAPSVEGTYRNLTILFERYSFGPDVGTFMLGEGTSDENFGNCPHCIFMKGESAAQIYFASGGELTVNEDAYTRELDISVKNLVLVPATVDPMTRASTPIPDAGCVAVEDFSYQRIFPAPGWTCEEERFMDGQACDCECGAPDPDCNGPAFCMPGDQACLDAYTPLPVAGCEASEICIFEPETMGSRCAATCDWEARSPCSDGSTCLYEFGTGDGDICVESPARFADVAIGQDCPSGGLFQLFCGLEQGFATGWCDFEDVCRPVCKEDSECTDPDHTCRFFLNEDGLGYCGPEPPEDG